MDNKRIYLSLAHMGGAELDYVNKAFETNWVVPLGPNVDEFEKSLETFLGEGKKVVALSSGTAAIHLALIQAGVSSGDFVICQSFTFAASANPIKYLGANPIFVDSELETWNISPELLEEAILDCYEKNKKTPKAIILVHLYGMPCKLNEIKGIAQKYNIILIEDAAEALGSQYNNKYCGTFGEFGVLSFNGNKIITTSGGGALITNTFQAAKKTIFLATQARDDKPYYHHSEIGYNYRLSNVCAGIGIGQMAVLSEHVNKRRKINNLYKEALAGIEGITFHENPNLNFDSNYWLTSVLLEKDKLGFDSNDLRLYLESLNIESRLLWKPLHLQPVFSDCYFYGNGVSENLFHKGICLPSSSSLTEDDIIIVSEKIKEFIVLNNKVKYRK